MHSAQFEASLSPLSLFRSRETRVQRHWLMAKPSLLGWDLFVRRLLSRSQTHHLKRPRVSDRGLHRRSSIPQHVACPLCSLSPANSSISTKVCLRGQNEHPPHHEHHVTDTEDHGMHTPHSFFQNRLEPKPNLMWGGWKDLRQIYDKFPRDLVFCRTKWIRYIRINRPEPRLRIRYGKHPPVPTQNLDLVERDLLSASVSLVSRGKQGSTGRIQELPTLYK